VPFAALLEENLASASPDLLRAMVKTFAEAMMSADVDRVCGGEYGRPGEARVNSRNGYRNRDWDTRVGTIDLAIPRVRSGSYFPSWLLERRRRAEQALISVVATCYLLGVSTRRVEKLAESLGVTPLSKSQVSEMAKHLDDRVAEFRDRPLDQGPYTFLWVDALTQKVREGGAWSTSTAWSRSASTMRANARSSVWTSPPARTAPAGWPSCARWSPAA
jgi:transposase-like protein